MASMQKCNAFYSSTFSSIPFTFSSSTFSAEISICCTQRPHQTTLPAIHKSHQITHKFILDQARHYSYTVCNGKLLVRACMGILLANLLKCRLIEVRYLVLWQEVRGLKDLI